MVFSLAQHSQKCLYVVLEYLNEQPIIIQTV